MAEQERRANEQSVAPTTTKQEDLTTSGQRRINLIWEVTQAIIAVVVVLGNVGTAIYFAVNRLPVNEFPFILSSTLFLVVGAYFQRTNHQLIGGVGRKATDEQEYRGR